MTTAAQDLDEELDEELSEESDADLDDFESDALAEVDVADDSYLRGMWGRYSFRASDAGDAQQLAIDMITAHGMVQAFVNAFARDGRYAVSFDPSISTAGTDLTQRSVIITPAPIADRSISAEEAGLVLTGLAVHEICHPRYGHRTAEAVARVFRGNRVADRLSNLLDDIRIERRFVFDYPGYAGVFAPTLSYVGAAGVKANGGEPHVQQLRSPVNLAIAATRYPTFSDWSAETAAEAAWWTAWADRWSKEDAPKRHVEAVRAALQHVADLRRRLPGPEPRKPTDDQDSYRSDPRGDARPSEANDFDEDSSESASESTRSAPSGAGDASHDSAGAGAPGTSGARSDEELNDATKYADADEGRHEPSCSGSDAVDSAVLDSGVAPTEVRHLKTDAQAIVDNSRNVESDGHGNSVDVAKSLKGLTHGGDRLGGSSLAQRYIRNAILRSRTGHATVDPFKRHGRLDQKGITRIAYGDTRVFERRTAPSPGKYLVWVMVDNSGSMTSESPHAAQVAHAMASATGGASSVRMAVWAWSDPFRPARASAGVAKVWETGQPVDSIFRLSGLRGSGTPDATVMSWSARAIRRDVRSEETPVIIFVSDGAGDNRMNERVAEARAMGIVVKSVSFGAGFGARAQEERFGRGNYVPWEGSIIRTAKPLAELFAKITSGR